MKKFRITTEYSMQQDYTIDAKNLEKAKQKAVEQFTDDSGIDDVDNIGVWGNEMLPVRYRISFELNGVAKGFDTESYYAILEDEAKEFIDKWNFGAKDKITKIVITKIDAKIS